MFEGFKDLGKVATGEITGDELLVKAENDAFLAKCQQRITSINALEASVEKLSDAQLRAKTKEFQDRLLNNIKGAESLDDLLEEAFAVVREAAWRVLELRHYDVQVTIVAVTAVVTTVAGGRRSRY